MLIRCLRQDTSIDIEYMTYCFPAEMPEELLVQRKLTGNYAATSTSRSVICMPLHTIRNSMVKMCTIFVVIDTSNCVNKLSPKNSPC